MWPALYIANLDDGPPPDEPFVVPAAWLMPAPAPAPAPTISLDLPPAVVKELTTASKRRSAAIARFHVINNRIHKLRRPHKKRTDELKLKISHLVNLLALAEAKIREYS